MDQDRSQRSDRPPTPVRLVGGDVPDGTAIEPKPGEASDVIGSVIGRRYEAIERIGSGRRGVVLLARDRLNDAQVVVKRLRTDEPLREAVGLALKAAELQASVRHPSIARVFEVGEDASGPYIVSEYIDGPDLSRYVATNGAMELAKAVELIGQIGEALIAAHESSLYHGSLRGSNVLIQDNGSLKVVDFSIAGLDADDEPRARRQDVRGVARTLCQLLTGVSRGTVNVLELPKSVRPVIRHAMGRSVASRQSTMELFLRELRASELEEGPLSEADLVRKGREAELSGSFAAMRAAGEEARQVNAESAEAMVLLRRADALEAEKNELTREVADRESSFDYAGALDALGKLIQRFPADHHVIRLAGQKRQRLAELTRLRGLGEQMASAGRYADALGSWQRVLELRPDDPAAQEHVRLGKRARLRRRTVATAASIGSLGMLGAAGYVAWTLTAKTEVPGLDETTAQATPTAPIESRPADFNPLVRSTETDEAVAVDDDDAVGKDARGGAAAAGIEAGTDLAGDAASADADGSADADRDRSAESFGEAVGRASRDADSARGHAVAAGAPGLASEVFELAQTRHQRGRRLADTGSFGEAAELLRAARGGYVEAAGAARARIASIESMIGRRELRAAGREIESIRSAAPEPLIDELERSAKLARAGVVELGPSWTVAVRYIEPGVFMMGSQADEPGRRSTEDLRRVRIERPFWIMATELTRADLARATGDVPPAIGSDLPATGLTLDDALALAARLTDLGPGTFSVPTESQWEYACRADSTELRSGMPAGDAAWYLASSGAELKPVGTLAPNAWGLYDSLGNAAELVIAPDLGHGEQVTMTRGGSYLSPASAVRAAARHELVPRDRGDARTGVRLLWTPDESP